MRNIMMTIMVTFTGIMSSITAQECCGVAEDFSVVADENLVDVFAIGNEHDIRLYIPPLAKEVGKETLLFRGSGLQGFVSNKSRSILAVMEKEHVNLVNSSGKIIQRGIVGPTTALAFDEGEFALLSSDKGMLFIDEHGERRGHVMISGKLNACGVGKGLFAVTSVDGHVYFFKNPSGKDLSLPGKKSAHDTTLQSLVYREGETSEISLAVRKIFVGVGAKDVIWGDGVFVVTNPQNNSVSVFNDAGFPIDLNSAQIVAEGGNRIYTESKLSQGLAYGAGSFVVANAETGVSILRKGEAIQHVALLDSLGNKGLNTKAVSFCTNAQGQGVFAIVMSNSRVFFMSADGTILGSRETVKNPKNIAAFKVHKQVLHVPASVRANTFENAIRQLGGSAVKSTMFPKTVDGFQMYLDAVGVRYFSAREMTRPNHPDKAKQCGFDNFLPPHEDWPKGAALALLADKMRALVNEPVKMRNWWRPSCYNSKVGGAKGSDHVQAFAVDLDFRSAQSRAKAQAYLCQNYWSGDLQLSVGLGGVTIHLGILSPKGKRSWKYSSYTKLPNSGNCW
ncbi:D-Ala-D-Ala carboxypeptidase family metallohydrolase [Candidatus Uabimicrobium amorphum]|uniref:Peptidase M15A C-terminal domain-containing protein n=1 Tax=Uabimicrobium amorphum TaxID=2596890 RepID=A0A5S9ISR0_UABAM|nr:D-Ala-D-Ala carboxypeptidase family metallohydrolase [Candidatus Uabimicrobium amorphum]BBM85965.1 hypothetical protein UABAM_04351 [Candidatus Uabimicrobium amorphum]